MAAVTWSANGGRLNSYRATIGNHSWALTLKAVGWVLENLNHSHISDVFVAPVTADASVAFVKAIPKAQAMA